MWPDIGLGIYSVMVMAMVPRSAPMVITGMVLMPMVFFYVAIVMLLVSFVSVTSLH